MQRERRGVPGSGARVGLTRVAVLIALLGLACAEQAEEDRAAPAPPPKRLVSVDAAVGEIVRRVEADPALAWLFTIDYAKRSGEFGFVMRPTKLVIFADHALDAELIPEDPLVALDLPFRVLVHQKPGGRIEVLHHPRGYLEKRHGITGPLLDRWQARLDSVVGGLPAVAVRAVPAESVARHGGITRLTSRRSVDETIEVIRKLAASEKPWHWYGEIDFRALSDAPGPMKVALFGRPKLGGRVMKPDVSLGLDYLVERALVWETDSGVQVAFDDIYWHTARRGLGVAHTQERAKQFTIGELRKAAQ